MTDLVTLVEPLKREIAVPGVFDDVFPDTSNTDLAATLADGFAQAQLDGFFPNLTVTSTTPFTVSEELSAAGGALVVLYAGMQIVRAQMRNLTLTARYKAGSVETETGRSAMILRDELTFMRTRIYELTTLARRSGRKTYVLDAYVSRSLANSALGGFYGYEYRG